MLHCLSNIKKLERILNSCHCRTKLTPFFKDGKLLLLSVATQYVHSKEVSGASVIVHVTSPHCGADCHNYNRPYVPVFTVKESFELLTS